MNVNPSESRPLRPGNRGANRGAVWFALLGGGVAWTLHLLLAYAVAEFGCLSGLGEKQLGGLTLVAWLLLGVTAGALALAAAATLVAAGIRRRSREPSEVQTEPACTLAFSGRLALATNVVFTLVIAVQSVPIFYFLRSC